jgi:NAD(P)H-nitrite reductase large subunit
MSYVIIGNGPAAVFAVEGIRLHDKNTPITIISKEDQYAYGRPLITYQLAGVIAREKMFLRDASFYEKNQVQVLLNKAAVKIDVKKKKVILNTKEEIPYQKLLIASGGTPFVPVNYQELMKNENVMSFITWSDMEKLEKLMPKLEKVMIIGGGLIGIKAAEALVMRGKKVYIAELSNRVLTTVMDEKGAYYFHKELEAQNVTLYLEDTVKDFKSQGGQVSSVTLNSGKEVQVDAVIVAIGVKPAMEFLEGTGITTGRGILVNEKLQSSEADIYAAGDISESSDFIYKDKRLGPIWFAASEQGRIAGENMAGANKSYLGRIVMNAISFMKTNLLSYGVINSEINFNKLQVLEHERKDSKIYRRLNIAANRLIGAVFINSIYRKGIITRFLKEELSVHEFKKLLLDPDYGFKRMEKSYRSKVINAIM